MDTPNRNKSLLAPLRAAWRDFSEPGVREALKVISPDAAIHLCHPLDDMTGKDLYDHAYAPLLTAMPDLERRDFIVMAGADEAGRNGSAAAGII